MRAVLDSNIIIDHLNGVAEATTEISRYDRAGISIITWMEVLVGAHDESEERALLDLLGRFEVIELSAPIAERAVELRRAHRLRLPDAIIWASALVRDALLVTRNTRDFAADRPEIRVPYCLGQHGRPGQE